MLMAVLTLWSSAKSFANILKESSPNCLNWFKVERHYHGLQHLSDLINEIFGRNVGIFLLDAILFYSRHSHEILVEDAVHRDWTKIVRLVFFVGSFFVTITISVNIVNQVHLLKEWLKYISVAVKQEGKEVSPEWIQLYLNDLTSHAVGMKGFRVYPITFSTIWEVGKFLVKF